MLRTIIILTIILMNACQDKSTDPESAVLLNGKKLPQKWELVAMSGMVADVPQATGADMEWQEYYLLGADGTFTKSREQGGTISEARGTYQIEELEDGNYLELTYDSDNDLIANCSGEAKELLKFDSEDKLIATWWACDGPGLYYEQVD